MQRLIYVSEIAPAATIDLAETMRSILLRATRLNLRDDITGFLLCDGTRFVQVLEGPPAELEACFGRISRDPRHRALRVRLRRDVSHRRFPRWSMCGLTLSAREDALLTTPVDIHFVRRAEPEAVLQHMAGIAARHGRLLDALHDALILDGNG